MARQRIFFLSTFLACTIVCGEKFADKYKPECPEVTSTPDVDHSHIRVTVHRALSLPYLPGGTFSAGDTPDGYVRYDVQGHSTTPAARTKVVKNERSPNFDDSCIFVVNPKKQNSLMFAVMDYSSSKRHRLIGNVELNLDTDVDLDKKILSLEPPAGLHSGGNPPKLFVSVKWKSVPTPEESWIEKHWMLVAAVLGLFWLACCGVAAALFKKKSDADGTEARSLVAHWQPTQAVEMAPVSNGNMGLAQDFGIAPANNFPQSQASNFGMGMAPQSGSYQQQPMQQVPQSGGFVPQSGALDQVHDAQRGLSFSLEGSGRVAAAGVPPARW